MKDIFVTNLYIRQIRHLKNLNIPLSSTERQHLILTGRNGSGKTSVLCAIKEYLRLIEAGTLLMVPGTLNNLETYSNNLVVIEQYLQKDLNELDRKSWKKQKEDSQTAVQDAKNYLDKLGVIIELSLQLNDSKAIINTFKKKDLILAFFGAKRLSEFKQPVGPQKMDFKSVHKLDEKTNSLFLQYLINLNYRKLNAIVQNQQAEVQKIDAWFDNFTKSLKNIFDEEKLELVYDIDNFNFKIFLPNRIEFDLNTLSDGYSAVLNILTELLLRMNHQYVQLYDIQGIVLIDEIETHLHIDLQKKILPFLTSFFPKIQFIVTTHSPFVLTSVKNAVIYDLEKQEPIQDLTGYSVDAVIEGYFNADKYSEIIKQKVDKYEQLMLKNNLSDDEGDELDELKQYFKQLPYFLAPELQFKIQQIQLSKLTR